MEDAENQNGLFDRISRSLRHAFRAPDDTPLSEEEKRLIRDTARAVVFRGMAAPAVLAIESSRPLGSLASGLAAFLDPLLAPLVPPHRLDALERLLERRCAADLLIAEISALNRP